MGTELSVSLIDKGRPPALLNLVELFQEEKERKLMIQIAELQKEAVEEEVSEIENMPEWKARVLGISKEDVL